MKILIVDDNLDIKPILEEAGRIAGLSITVLSSALEAIDYLSKDESEVDGVLIDLAMYPIDGISLA